MVYSSSSSRSIPWIRKVYMNSLELQVGTAVVSGAGAEWCFYITAMVVRGYLFILFVLFVCF